MVQVHPIWTLVLGREIENMERIVDVKVRLVTGARALDLAAEDPENLVELLRVLTGHASRSSHRPQRVLAGPTGIWLVHSFPETANK